MTKLHLVIVIISITLKLTWALPPFMDPSVGEGTCSNLQFHPVDVNADFANSLVFFPVGNKFLIYLFASVLPNYNQIREENFPSEACYKRKVNNNLVEISGFGRHLSTWQTSQDGIFTGFLQIEPRNDKFLAKCVVSLTDGHSYIFLTCCKTLLDEKEWVVFSKTSYLDQRTINLIEAHAISLGFDWNRAIFLNYDGCHMGWKKDSYNSHY